MARPGVRTFCGPWMLAACLLLSAVFVTNVVRAYCQSITYDEAVTYHYYVAAPWGRLIGKLANNHLINSLGCRATTWLFGASEFTLRMPSLAGGTLYLASLLLICRHVFGTGPFLLFATGLIALNPLVLDFLSAARGYGLALGFLLAGMYQLLLYLDCPDGGPENAKGRRRLPMAAVCLALAVHSNLSFLIGAGALVLAFLAIAVQNGRTLLPPDAYASLLRSLRRDFLRPGLVLFGVLAISLIKMRPDALNYGTGSPWNSLRGMGEASLQHHHTTWPWDNESPAFQAVIDIGATWGASAVLLAVALACTVVALRWVRSHRGFDTLHKDERFLLLCGGSLLLSCLGVFVFHFVFGRNYPYQRTGLYLVPGFFLAGLTLLQAALHRGKARLLIGVPCLAMASLVIVQFAVQLPTTHYSAWRYDCTSRNVFETIAERADQSSDAPVRVACHWLYLQSLNFYRATHRATWIEFVQMKPDQGRHDFYVYPREEPPRAAEEWTPLFQSAESDVVVAAPGKKGDATLLGQKDLHPLF